MQVETIATRCFDMALRGSFAGRISGFLWILWFADPLARTLNRKFFCGPLSEQLCGQPTRQYVVGPDYAAHKLTHIPIDLRLRSIVRGRR